MDDREVLGRADQILRDAGLFPEDPTTENFFHYAQQVSEAVKDWSPSKRAKNEWLMPWAEAFRKLYDNFDRIVEADPMLLYQPANRASREFHSSDALFVTSGPATVPQRLSQGTLSTIFSPQTSTSGGIFLAGPTRLSLSG